MASDTSAGAAAAFLADAGKRWEAFGEADAFPRLLAAIEAVHALCMDTDGNYLHPDAHLPVGEFQAALVAALLGEGSEDGPA